MSSEGVGLFLGLNNFGAMLKSGDLAFFATPDW